MRIKDNDVTLFEYGVDQMPDPCSNNALMLFQVKWKFYTVFMRIKSGEGAH